MEKESKNPVMTMTKDSRILLKKLNGIESLLKKVASLPQDDDGDGDEDTLNKRKRYCEEIKRRLVFVTNLLSAEIASSTSGKPPHHLRHVGERLLELHNDFNEWKKEKEVIAVDQLDNVETESTSTSCQNEEAESAVTAVEVGVEEEEDAEEEEEEEREGLPLGRFIRVFACGVAIGMSLMGFVFVRLCGSFDYQTVPSLAPT